jgi:hypothetical protein
VPGIELFKHGAADPSKNFDILQGPHQSTATPVQQMLL